MRAESAPVAILNQALDQFYAELSKSWPTLQVELVRYARSLLNGKYLARGRLPEGFEVEDVVGEALKKTLAGLKTEKKGKGLRKWDPSKCTLRQFLFGTVKSDISDLVNRKDNQVQPLSEDNFDVCLSPDNSRFHELMSALQGEVSKVSDSANVMKIIRAAEQLSKLNTEINSGNLRDCSGLSANEFKNAKRTLDRAVERLLERRQ